MQFDHDRAFSFHDVRGRQDQGFPIERCDDRTAPLRRPAADQNGRTVSSVVPGHRGSPRAARMARPAAGDGSRVATILNRRGRLGRSGREIARGADKDQQTARRERPDKQGPNSASSMIRAIHRSPLLCLRLRFIFEEIQKTWPIFRGKSLSREKNQLGGHHVSHDLSTRIVRIMNPTKRALHAPARRCFNSGFSSATLTAKRLELPRRRNDHGNPRGINMLFLTNRKAMITPAIRLTFLLTLSFGAGLGWGGASLQADDKANVALFKPFQGTWVSTGEGIDATFIFDGEKVTASVAGMEYTARAKVDTAAKPHATIDLTLIEGPEEAKGKKAKGIYKFDGERLTLCLTVLDREERPADFAAIDDEIILFELKKEKKKD